MKQTTQMGIGNTVSSETEILHSGVIGRTGFGRIADLVASWCERVHGLPVKPIADLRLLIQALLEFSHQKKQTQLGQFEFAIEEQRIFASVRLENQIFSDTDSVERALSQYWLNSEDASMLKRILHPQDRVEVRFNQKLNLIEWRVCRSLKPESITHQDSSFLVMLDDLPMLISESNRYADLGDLPYQEWLNEVYKNSQSQSRSGEFFAEGESLQNEAEWARVVASREKDELENEIRIAGGKLEANHDETVVLDPLSEEENDGIQESSRKYVEEMRIQLLNEQAELKENVKEVILGCKKRELRALREVVLLQQKVQMFEKLLHKKEVIVQKAQSENRLLNQKLEDQKKEKDQVIFSANGNAFREKALQMYEQLKKVKEENSELEKKVIELQHRGKQLENGDVDSASNQQLDDLNKKLERLQRALDGEKSKVKTLSERVIIAEKDAQSASPLIEDLEKKVENTLKIAQQHKKETEQIKQKLVQAEGEKNKIKNELVKAQAQIQTLMKRHAS